MRITSVLYRRHYDLAVVGAGVEGSWTALQALVRKSRAHVTLLEQYPLPHSRGSSHGQSRIIRHSYAERFQAEMMPEAFRQWRQLEKDCGRTLLVPVPLLCLGADAHSQSILDAMLDSLRHVLPAKDCYHELSPDQVRRDFPEAKFTSEHRGLLETSAGVLLADKCMKIVQSKFLSLGGEILDNTKVLSIQQEQSYVRLDIGPTSYITADKVAVCAGPWTSHLLDPLLPQRLPLTPLRVMAHYWRLKSPGCHLKVSFKDMTGQDEFWGIPVMEHCGLAKISHPWPKQVIDPDVKGQGPTKEDDICQQMVSEYISRTLKGLDATYPEIIQPCIYTMSPDEVSIIDHLPGNDNIAFACGFSGSGFKKAPVVGQMLLQLLYGDSTEWNMSPFALSRFTQSAALH